MAKYKAVLVENTLSDDCGKWAVGHGKKYFLWAVFETQLEAEEAALQETIRWHMSQIDAAVDKIAEVTGQDRWDINWQDYVC